MDLRAVDRMHRELVRALAADHGRLVRRSPSCKSYQRCYRRAFAGLDPQPLSWPAIRAKAAGADLLLIGDDHSERGAPALAGGFLRDLAAAGRQARLVLESIPSEHQVAVDAFARGELHLEELAALVGFERQWGFPWRNHGSLLELARSLGIAILAAGDYARTRSQPSRRDAACARLLAGLDRDLKSSPLVLLFGEEHLAPPHLPARLGEIFDPARFFLLHRNPTPLSHRLLPAALRGSQHFRLAGRSFATFDQSAPVALHRRLLAIARRGPTELRAELIDDLCALAGQLQGLLGLAGCDLDTSSFDLPAGPSRAIRLDDLGLLAGRYLAAGGRPPENARARARCAAAGRFCATLINPFNPRLHLSSIQPDALRRMRERLFPQRAAGPALVPCTVPR